MHWMEKNPFFRFDGCSFLFPRPFVACWFSVPIVFEWPRRMLSTPAMNVVATAPRPGVRMPRRPLAGAMDSGASAEDVLANYFSILVYDCARRVAGIDAAFGGEGGSLTMRIGLESRSSVARYTKAIR